MTKKLILLGVSGLMAFGLGLTQPASAGAFKPYGVTAQTVPAAGLSPLLTRVDFFKAKKKVTKGAFVSKGFVSPKAAVVKKKKFVTKRSVVTSGAFLPKKKIVTKKAVAAPKPFFFGPSVAFKKKKTAIKLK